MDLNYAIHVVLRYLIAHFIEEFGFVLKTQMTSRTRVMNWENVDLPRILNWSHVDTLGRGSLQKHWAVQQGVSEQLPVRNIREWKRQTGHWVIVPIIRLSSIKRHLKDIKWVFQRKHIFTMTKWQGICGCNCDSWRCPLEHQRPVFPFRHGYFRATMNLKVLFRPVLFNHFKWRSIGCERQCNSQTE